MVATEAPDPPATQIKNSQERGKNSEDEKNSALNPRGHCALVLPLLSARTREELLIEMQSAADSLKALLTPNPSSRCQLNFSCLISRLNLMGKMFISWFLGDLGW